MSDPVQNIIIEVCANRNITQDQLFGPQRARKFVSARKECAKALKAIKLSFPEIGKLMNRDHSTIIHYIKPVPSHMPKRGYMDLNVKES